MAEFQLKLPLGEAAETFNLEKAVCSHGLFMMAPNRWDPITRSYSRPLHLDDGNYSSVMVSIYHPQEHSHSLHVKVHNNGSGSLSPLQQETLLGQIARMLRLSETDERNVREFKKKVSEVDYMKCYSGRVFRSPTLFEDMVKCILLCNCRWPRTLSMARALCDLQYELQHCSSSISVAETKAEASANDFIPKTPAGKESKRKLKVSKVSTKLTRKIVEMKAGFEAEDDSYTSNELSTADSNMVSVLESSNGIEPYAWDRIGNFPSPRELANLDEGFLAKRCSLGYRAGRILKLAQGIVEGRIQLRQLEEVGKEASLSSYDKLSEQLSEIDGFGPFTSANVLVCMGFYHVIPTDSETIRHLKQVHARKSTITTIQRDVEVIYGKYAPFQFLAYWSELWHFYEERFGKLSEMRESDYKLITASNMRKKISPKVQRKETLRRS